MHTIRKAIASDAGALAELAEQIFRDTFGAENTPEDMATHCEASYGEAIQAAEIADPEQITLLSEEGNQLVGFAQLQNPSNQGSVPGCVAGQSPGHVHRLYVASGWHGKGIAGDLLQTGLNELKTRGCDVVWLGVWEHNPRAIAFYRKFGFVQVGDHDFMLGNDRQRDLIMARPVSVE